MKWTKSFIPTLRDVPAEAESPSHALLLRAGYIRQLSSGHYTMLPLGVKVRAKIIKIIEEEMDAIGAQQLFMPSMHPAELWEKSDRISSFDILYRFTDQRGNDIVLGPTHEEVITNISSELQSYKELPQMWYQIQTKFRDEARPKSGLLRVREFTMKDSYSLDLDQAGLDRSFELHKEAYKRIFKRLGLEAVGVEASSGSMGGSESIEFVSTSEHGEDDIVFCSNCDYASNAEKAISILEKVEPSEDKGVLTKFDTPNIRTIAELENFTPRPTPAKQQIKTLVYMIDDVLTLVLLRGDYELIEQKLLDATAATKVRPAHEDEIKQALGASPGSLGAVKVNLPVIADMVLEQCSNMTTGANEDNIHYFGVDIERDIKVDKFANLRRVKSGEACPNCNGALNITQGIEVGHIFKLGYKFTNAFEINVLGPDGKQIRPIMGCYGIGIERNLAACVERNHDDKGIIWPLSIAPYHVAVIPLNSDNEQVMAAAEVIYEELNAGGIEVIMDDREARAGVKLADVELVGIPVRVTIGKRGIVNKTVEITTRHNGETIEVPLSDAAGAIDKILANISV